jgi:NADH-quinone oxidoreductase subunit L
VKAILLLLLLFPLLGAIFHALPGRSFPRRIVQWVACASVLASFIMAVLALVSAGGGTYAVTFFNWIVVDDFSAAMNVYYDPLSAVMALMVTFVSSLIHIYSVSYMRDDEDYARFFCYLNLFVFSMLVITLADNLVFLFLGWEGVGFCSYALIGFWYRDVVNAAAGRKAFLLTRIGDVAFGIAIALFFLAFNNLSISHINAHVPLLSTSAATLLGLLLLWSAVGKSAQLPLVVWLPDAMAGPTPVSALIHAATMVTAGVYLLMRLYPVVALSPTAMLVIGIVGAATAFYAACSALAQRDIKRVLAYSTISQVGYMFLGVGAGDLIGGMFHLLTHAFFKALLFLSAGCIIQALHEEHDIFRMGHRVRGFLPSVFWVFLAGALALGAIPPSAGFLSKDRVLLATFTHSGEAYKYLWAIGTLTAFLTTLYSFRLFFSVFFGEPAAAPDSTDTHREMQPLPRPMIWVLWPLASLALFAGFINLPPVWGGGEWLAHYLSTVSGAVPELGVSHATEWTIAVTDAVIATTALILAYFLYGPKNVLSLRSPEAPGQGLTGFFFSGFYLDRLYQAAIVRPYRGLADVLWHRIDEGVVDNALVNSGRLLPTLSNIMRLWTTGKLSTYLGMLFLGFTVILCVLAWARWS